MFIDNIGINSIEWSAAGTMITVGFTRSASNGREDDAVLDEVVFSVSNEDIKPFLSEIEIRFKEQTLKAIGATISYADRVSN